MKIMRTNYDKKHRCPNWSGPAFKAGGGPCPSGSFSRQMYEVEYYNGKNPDIRFHKCEKCDTVVLPYILRNLDPTWWKFRLEWKLREMKDRVEDWKRNRDYRKG